MGPMSFISPRFALSLVLLFGIASLAHAGETEGTFRLVKRQLPDGAIQKPPAVGGMLTMVKGNKHRTIFWHTPDGKLASANAISTYRITPTKYTETLIYSSYDDGSGTAESFSISSETKSTSVTRKGGRISFQLPFEPPSVVFEGNKMTATSKGEFVDYWERIH